MLPTTVNGETDVLSGLLRRYLRELPEPLVPVSFYKPLVALLTSSKKFKNGKDRGGVAAVKELVESPDFPRVNYHALRRVCGLLRSMLTSWWSDSGESGKLLEIMSLNIMRPDNLKRATSSNKEFVSIKEAVSNLVTHSLAIFVKSSSTDSHTRRISMIKKGEKASRHQLLEGDLETSSGNGPDSARSRRLPSFSLAAETPRLDMELRAELRSFKEITNAHIKTLTETVAALRSEIDVLKKRLARDGTDTFASAQGSDIEDFESPPITPHPKRSDSLPKIAPPPKKKSSGRTLDDVGRKSSKGSIEGVAASKKDSKKSLKAESDEEPADDSGKKSKTKK